MILKFSSFYLERLLRYGRLKIRILTPKFSVLYMGIIDELYPKIRKIQKRSSIFLVTSFESRVLGGSFPTIGKFRHRNGNLLCGVEDGWKKEPDSTKKTLNFQLSTKFFLYDIFQKFLFLWVGTNFLNSLQPSVMLQLKYFAQENCLKIPRFCVPSVTKKVEKVNFHPR